MSWNVAQLQQIVSTHTIHKSHTLSLADPGKHEIQVEDAYVQTMMLPSCMSRDAKSEFHSSGFPAVEHNSPLTDYVAILIRALIVTTPNKCYGWFMWVCEL